MRRFHSVPLLSAAERVYRLLMFLYPCAFRREYGRLMVQVYRDLCQNAVQQRGMAGLAALWLRLLADLLTSAIRQHADVLRARGKVLLDKDRAPAMAAATVPLSVAGWPGLTLRGGQLMIKRGVLLGLSTLLVLSVCGLTVTWLYTTTWLRHAEASYGLYRTPEEGMSALLWGGQHQIEPQYIQYSGPSCFIRCSPHVWFVHVAGSGQGGGAYFLHVKEGWVHMPETAFPDLIGLGMSLFGLAPRS